MWNWLVKQYNDVKGNAKWAAIAAFWWVVINYGKRMLNLIPHIPAWVVDSLLFCFSLIVFVWLATRKMQLPAQTQSGAIMNATITAENTEFYVKRVDEFYQTYDNTMLRETEANVVAIANTKAQSEREQFFVRFIASGVLNYVFDSIWFGIYASQIKALQTLNSRTLKREEIRVFYDAAASAFPDTYKKYSFDQWVGYLRANVLILENNDKVAITKRGREFLKYTVHLAKPVDMKKF